MPELPEVETVRRRLVPHLTGRTLAEVEILDYRLTDPEPPSAVAARLSGRRIEALGRRGKYLLMELDDGAALVVHLRMTGNVLWLPSPPETAPPFLRARALLDDGSYLGYTDIRRFGTWRVGEDGAEVLLAGKLGPEPLGDWTAADLARALAGRKAPVKAALLDQRVVAGVGNIYADEALWAARIHPLSPAGRLSRARVVRLHDAVRDDSPGGHRRPGRLDPRLPHARRRLRLRTGALRRLRPRRRALRALRNHAAPHRGRAARHGLLPPLPAVLRRA